VRIQVDTSLPDHRKTRRLARALKIDQAHAVGLLVCLWRYVELEAADGHIGDFDADDVAFGAKWSGDAETLVGALVEVGFVDCDGYGELAIHDWHDPDHTGGMLKKRAQARERKRRQRERDGEPRSRDVTRDGGVTSRDVTPEGRRKKEEGGGKNAPRDAADSADPITLEQVEAGAADGSPRLSAKRNQAIRALWAPFATAKGIPKPEPPGWARRIAHDGLDAGSQPSDVAKAVRALSGSTSGAEFYRQKGRPAPTNVWRLCFEAPEDAVQRFEEDREQAGGGDEWGFLPAGPPHQAEASGG